MWFGRLVGGLFLATTAGTVLASYANEASLSKPLHLVQGNSYTFLSDVVSDLKARMMDFHQSVQGKER